MDEQQQQMGRIIAKAWADEAFKAALIADPVTTLKAEGIPVPEGLSLTVVENTSAHLHIAHLHIVLPPKPQEGEISEETLSSVGGGGGALVENCLFGAFCVVRGGVVACRTEDFSSEDGRIFRAKWNA